MTFKESITKEEAQQLPIIRFEGTIHVIDTQEKLSRALSELKHETLLGFDTETKPTFNKGEYNQTAIIQLSTEEVAYLFRINTIGFGTGLKKLLGDPEIKKIGISIKDDLKDLIKIAPDFKPEGFEDLNDISRDLGIKQIGMRSLCGIFLDHRVSKSQQTSNWENPALSNAQQKYASTDAWVCLKMYSLLDQKGYLN